MSIRKSIYHLSYIRWRHNILLQISKYHTKYDLIFKKDFDLTDEGYFYEFLGIKFDNLKNDQTKMTQTVVIEQILIYVDIKKEPMDHSKPILSEPLLTNEGAPPF